MGDLEKWIIIRKVCQNYKKCVNEYVEKHSEVCDMLFQRQCYISVMTVSRS